MHSIYEFDNELNLPITSTIGLVNTKYKALHLCDLSVHCIHLFHPRMTFTTNTGTPKNSYSPLTCYGFAKKTLTLDGSEESREIQQNDPNWAVEPMHFEDVSHFVQLAI